MDTIHMGSESKSHGALIGSAIIVVILIIGGIYYYKSAKIQILEDQARAEQALLESEAQVESINEQSDSDATADIEYDLETTDIDSLIVE